MAHKNEHIDWDVSDQERVSRAVRRKVRRRRRKFPALLLLLCLVLFCGGFILGQATEPAPAKSEDPAVADGTGHVDRVGSAVLQVLHQHPEVDALVVVPTGG